MLQVIEFINTHKDWRTLLSNAPYHINIKSDGYYTLLMYDQIKSDFSQQIVRECRGLIISPHSANDDTYVPRCIPFFKFGNYGEKYCPAVDWSSARVQEKIDGSIIKVWHHAHWHISTNSCIDAGQATIHNDYKITFRELFDEAVSRFRIKFWQQLDYDKTYMFELVSPKNRIVVPYEETKVYHIGTRSNVTLKEEDIDIGIPKPLQFSFKSINECIDSAQSLPYNCEGYVVVDKDWNRVKIKSPAYVAVHLLHNNGVITTSRIIDILRADGIDDFLAYFPDYREQVEKVQRALNLLENELSDRCRSLDKMTFNSRKDFALEVKDDKYSAFYFQWRSMNTDPREWIGQLPVHRLAEYVQAIVETL